MVAEVLVELSNKNVDRVFDYTIPSFLQGQIKKGIRVTVPFGHQVLEGFVLNIKSNSQLEDLKEIIDVVSKDIILTDELLELGKSMAKKTLSTLISCYQVMLPRALKAKIKNNIPLKKEKIITVNLDNLNDKQKLIIEQVQTNHKMLKKDLNKISASSLKTLINKGILLETEEEVYRLNHQSDSSTFKYPLTPDQQKVVDTILKYQNTATTFLLHGVTGSGKTEVYMELIEKMLACGKTSIVLVPEISLTPQLVERFKRRFTESIAILHSRLSEGEKYDEYRKISRGEVKIVIGARSAVFAPLKNIGLFVIDEEHTSSYKQENMPRYNAIDIAIERSLNHNSLVVLGSATPSLTTYAKALKGLYVLVTLPHRIGNKTLPNVTLVDMNREKKKNDHFSKELINLINDRLSKKEQIILLLNRRGYSSFVSCSNCGYVSKCPSCDITLTYHKSSNMLRCHYCGYAQKYSINCNNCHEDSMKNLGVGTEKIEEELHNLFACKVVRMDYDTTSKKGSHEKIINDFKDQKYDILLGTQMIAKGLDFANVTLVGVINADTSLMLPNYKSSEDTFQLLCQVSGRSGRGDKKGDVIIQTFNPDHYAIYLAKNHDYLNFFKQEMNIRKKLNYPPYYYLVSLKIISNDYSLAVKEANKVAEYLKNNLKTSIILGPSVSNVFKINNNYRFQVIIKYKKDDTLYGVLEKLIDYYKSNHKVKIDIDFNPNQI